MKDSIPGCEEPCPELSSDTIRATHLNTKMATIFRYRGVLCQVTKNPKYRNRWNGWVIGRKNAPYLTWCTIYRGGQPVFETKIPDSKSEAISLLKKLVDHYLENGSKWNDPLRPKQKKEPPPMT